MKIKIVTYEPDNSIKNGYMGIFNEIFNEFVENRWLTTQLFKRDFFATYKQSLFGVFWAFIMPIISMSTFILLNRAGLFTIGDINVPYPIYAVLGLAFWQLFSSGIVASSGSLVKAGNMISQINFSRKSLVLASTAQSIISFFIQFAFLLVLFLIYKIKPNNGIFLTPVLVLPILFLTFGFGFILSILNGIMRDIGNVIALLMSLLLFLTPVLYAKPQTGALSKLTYINPLYYLISSSRDIVLFGKITDYVGYFSSVTFSIFVFISCLIIFHLTEARIIERI